MTSPFAASGARLRDQGLSILPIMPGDKAPGRWSESLGWMLMHDWSKYATRLPSERHEVETWERWPEAGVGLALGPASAPAGFQLVALDIDTDCPEITAAILNTAGPSPVRKKGRTGQTCFYLASAEVKKAKFDDGPRPSGKRILDVLTEGRQTVLPPTLHPGTGQPYFWLTDDTLEEFDVAKLPILPDDIVERLAVALAPHGHVPEEIHAAAPGSANLSGESVHRSLNDAALAHLDAWVPALSLFGCIRAFDGYRAVAHWRASATGRPLSQRKPNLSIKPVGIKDFNGGGDKGYTPLDLVMAACGTDLDTAFRWLEERVSPQKVVRLTATIREPEPAPVQETREEAEEPRQDGRSNLAGMVGRNVAPVASLAADGASPTLLPERHCTPPGLLGEVVEWMTATAAKPVPQHNLGAAIGLLGAVMGRRYESPTRARTNFYVMGLAPSGFGKDHPMAAARSLAMSCNLQKFMAAEETKSDSAIRKMLERWPVAFLLMDELGGFMKKVLDRRAASHDKRQRDLLLTLFSRANQDYLGSEGATERAVMIQNPHLCLYGVSTPDDLWDAFDSSSGKDGFLARFLVLDAGNKRPRRVRPAMDVTEPPRELRHRVAEILNVGAGNLAGMSGARPKPIRADWGPGAEEWFFSCDERNMDNSDRGGARGTIYARAAEHTLKLALVYAVGCDHNRPVITVAGLEWASVVVETSNAALFAAMDDRVADNDKQKEHLKVMRLIRDAGPWGISRRDLVKAINGAFDGRRLTEIIGQLREAEDVEQYVGAGPKGGRPTERLRSTDE